MAVVNAELAEFEVVIGLRKETFFQLVSIEGAYSHVFEISIVKKTGYG